MEENISEIKTTIQYRKCKEEVFADNNMITAARIRQKYNNIKSSQHNTKAIAKQSSFRRIEKDYSQSINSTLLTTTLFTYIANYSIIETLNRKCQFYQRFNSIFAPRADAVAVTSLDTLNDETFEPNDIPTSPTSDRAI